MKTKLFIAAISTAFLAGCSSDSVVSDVTVEDPIAQGYEPIQLSLGRSTVDVATTRGTGTVGSTSATDNKWFYEDLRVLMLQRPDNTFVEGFTSGLDDVKNFDNKFVAVPSQVSDNNVTLDYLTYTSATRYYPQTGYSQFFAYHIDDAATTAGALIARTDLRRYLSETTKSEPELTRTVTTDAASNPVYEYTTDFQIDGSQDLMAGKATNYYTDPTTSTTYVGFGSLTARRAVVPNIVMEHLLSRFEFGVIPGARFNGTEYVTDIKDVKITGISMETATKGTMLVAYINEDETSDMAVRTASDLITNWNTPAYVSLKATPTTWKDETLKAKNDMVASSNLIDFSTKDADELKTYAQNSTPYAVPDASAALFVQPNLTNYKLRVDLEYSLTGELATKSDKIDLNVKLPDNSPFLPGTSYHVDLVIYGPSEIEVKVTLVPWVNAGTLTIDTEDPENPAWQAAN